MNTRYRYERDGGVLFDEELIVLNSWIAQAQAGLDLTKAESAIQAQEIWPSRLADDLKARTGKEFSPTEAYLLAMAITGRLKELQESFTKGL